MIMDSTTLDSGLSAVDLSILTRTTSALPLTTFIHTLLDDVDAATARATLGIECLTTLASAATPNIWTATCNVINYTGTTTATGFTAAPQAGARRTLVCAGAAPFTAGANMLIDGALSGETLTFAVGDKLHVTAVSTTQFRISPEFYAKRVLTQGVIRTAGVVYTNIKPYPVFLQVNGSATALGAVTVTMSINGGPTFTLAQAYSGVGSNATFTGSIKIPQGATYVTAEVNVGSREYNLFD